MGGNALRVYDQTIGNIILAGGQILALFFKVYESTSHQSDADSVCQKHHLGNVDS